MCFCSLWGPAELISKGILQGAQTWAWFRADAGKKGGRMLASPHISRQAWQGLLLTPSSRSLSSLLQFSSATCHFLTVVYLSDCEEEFTETPKETGNAVVKGGAAAPALNIHCLTRWCSQIGFTKEKRRFSTEIYYYIRQELQTLRSFFCSDNISSCSSN